MVVKVAQVVVKVVKVVVKVAKVAVKVAQVGVKVALEAVKVARVMRRPVQVVAETFAQQLGMAGKEQEAELWVMVQVAGEMVPKPLVECSFCARVTK